MKLITGVAVLWLVGVGLPGQSRTPPGPAEFRWATVDARVFPDTANGVEVVFFTRPQLAPTGTTVPFVYLDQTFEPADVARWVASAESLLAVPASAPARRPLTLVGRDSSLLVVAWGESMSQPSRAYLAIYPRPDSTDSKPLDVGIDTADLRSFLDTLGAKARLSHVAPNLPARDARVLSANAVGEKPEILSGPPATYPEQLRLRGIQGWVLLQAVVDTQGRVEPASLRVISYTDPGFMPVARAQLLQTRFRPARLDGQPVRVLVRVPINFTLRVRSR